MMPGQSEDLLIVKSLPDIVVISNAPEFRKDKFVSLKGEKLLDMIFTPSFEESSKIVLIDFDSLNHEIVDFQDNQRNSENS